MAIKIEQNGQMIEVTKHQLFALAKRGDILPGSRVVVNGTETTAEKIKGIEFKETPAIDDSPFYQTMEATSPVPPPFANELESEFVPSAPVAVPYARAKRIEASSMTFGEKFFLDPKFTNFWTVSYLQTFWWWYVLFSYIAFSIGVLTIIFETNPLLGGETASLKILGIVILALGILLELIIMRIILEVILVLFKIAEYLKSIDIKTEERHGNP